MPRAGSSSERPATRACGLPGLAPSLPAPPWVPRLGVGVGVAQPQGAEVIPENFPRTGCVGDFHRRPPRWGVVGRALGVIPVSGGGWEDSSLYFPLPPLTSPDVRSPLLFCPSSFGRRWVGVCVGARLWGRPWARSCLLPFSLASLGLRCPCSGESHGTAARWLSAVTLWVCVNINCWELRKARFLFIGCYWVSLSRREVEEDSPPHTHSASICILCEVCLPCAFFVPD